MSFLGKLFGRKEDKTTAVAGGQSSSGDPSKNPDMIKVFDGYGREMFITKQQWRDKVLLGNLEEKKNDPDALYTLILGALNDGFAADIIPYAEHLYKTDPMHSRSAVTLGVVYMEVNRLDDAERVFSDYLQRDGANGIVLSNMAKVHCRRGNKAKAESVLWHALEVDPNQDNGLVWYAAIHNERGGKQAMIDALQRAAQLPKSWRARLWLAREALEAKDLPTATELYEEALSTCERPVPSDLLMQMSGDLGNNGQLSEIIRLTEPHFQPDIHGLQVGNNLIKAKLELGLTGEARHVLDQLYAQKRPDWRQTLDFWDTELAKRNLSKNTPSEGQFSCSLLSIEGPLWAREKSPFARLLPTKRDSAPRIEFFGSTAVLERAPDEPTAQLSDPPGRLSRAIPLILSEKAHLMTDAVSLALIPWVKGKGFALFGKPYEVESLCGIAEKREKEPDYIVSIILDARGSAWSIKVVLINRKDRKSLGEASVETHSENPGPAVETLCKTLFKMLKAHTGISTIAAPAWYRLPEGRDASDYLLRLEQQLAVACMGMEGVDGGGLSGEHSILDGILWLCKSQPGNATVRIVLAETLRKMKKVRPEIVAEYKDKVIMLQREHPLAGEAAAIINKAIAQVFED